MCTTLYLNIIRCAHHQKSSFRLSPYRWSPLPVSLSLLWCPIPPGNHYSVLCMYVFGFFLLFIYFLLIFYTLCTSEVMYLSFSIWLLSLSIIPSKFIHIITNGKILSFFMAEWYSIAYLYTHAPHLIYPFICWWTFSCLRILVL